MDFLFCNMTWTWRILSETETNESIMYRKDRPHQQGMKPNVYWLSEQDGDATRQFASENHDCLRGLVNIENYFYTKTLLISSYPELAYPYMKLIVITYICQTYLEFYSKLLLTLKFVVQGIDTCSHKESGRLNGPCASSLLNWMNITLML